MILDVILGAFIGTASMVVDLVKTIATTFISFVTGSFESSIAFVVIFVIFIFGLAWFAFSSGITIETALLGNVTYSTIAPEDALDPDILEYMNNTQLVRVSYTGGGQFDNSVILFSKFPFLSDEDFLRWQTGYDSECYASAVSKDQSTYVWEETLKEDPLQSFFTYTLVDTLNLAKPTRIYNQVCGFLTGSETVQFASDDVMGKRVEIEEYQSNGSLCVDYISIGSLPWTYSYSSAADCYMIQNTGTRERIYFSNPTVIEGLADPYTTAFLPPEDPAEKVVPINQVKLEVTASGPLTPIISIWFMIKEGVYNNIGSRDARNLILDVMGFAEGAAEAIFMILLVLIGCTVLLIIGRFRK